MRVRTTVGTMIVALQAGCVTAPIIGNDPAAFRAKCAQEVPAGASPAVQEIHAGACFEIGRALVEGAGVERDAAAGASYLERACALSGLGAREACVALGDLAMHGTEGVAKSPEGAAKAFARGCDLGHILACRKAGALFDGDNGVPADPARAFAAFDQACGRGDGPSCAFSGLASQTGNGTAKSIDFARLAYARGCELDHGPCCAFAALVAADPETAARYSRRACELGEECPAK